MCHCAHTQGLLTAKAEHWMNGALKDCIQIKHALYTRSSFQCGGSVEHCAWKIKVLVAKGEDKVDC